jgi:hypothetical protein
MAVTRTDFNDLRQELRSWEAEGLRASLWLRDDDLVRSSERMDAMSRVLERFRLRALVSIIPALMEKDLPSALQDYPYYVPCQHGFAHKNHEPDNAPKAEFGPARPLADAEADILAGRQLLTEAFGDRLTAIFVPPWNRITPSLAAKLPQLGINGLSGYTRQLDGAAVPGLAIRDADIDVLNWEMPEDGGVAVMPPAAISERLVMILKNRREHDRWNKIPIGILTHHRAMNSLAWDVVAAVVQETCESGIADWRDPATLFGHE